MQKFNRHVFFSEAKPVFPVKQEIKQEVKPDMKSPKSKIQTCIVCKKVGYVSENNKITIFGHKNVPI